jgi:DNA-binding HxlR family transcriptional regulator
MGWEAIESGFRARAGTLTLLLIAGSGTRENLLEILAEASLGIPVSDQRRQEWAEEEADLGPPTGPETPYVTFTLEQWLRNSPHGPLQLRTEQAGVALAGLVCGWASKITHTLAREPRSLRDLERAIPSLDRGYLKAQLGTMESAGQVEALSGSGGRTRYRVTDWLREGTAPLAAAARLERHQHHEDTEPPDELDIEAAFLLALPLLALPVEPSGSCRLAVQMPGDAPPVVGVMAEIEEGHVVCCGTELEDDADTWASGSPIGWMDTLVEPTVAQVESGGDQRLAHALLEGLHQRLFGIPVR